MITTSLVTLAEEVRFLTEGPSIETKLFPDPQPRAGVVARYCAWVESNSNILLKLDNRPANLAHGNCFLKEFLSPLL